jgi:two-component system, OmpR family, sensor kinase
LNLSVRDRVRLLHFAGTVTGNGIFIAGATTRSGLTQTYEQHVCLCEGPLESQQVTGTIASPQSLQVDGDNEVYNDLARLNNELTTLQRELIKRTVELEKLNEQKNEFVGIAAHDLRNPLQIITNYSRLLLTERVGALTPQQHKMVSAISRSSDFMLRLVTDLLTISQFEAGRLQLDLRPTDLVNLIGKNIELNRLLAEQKQIHLSLSIDEELPPLLLDPSKIEQVLNNLIQNAIKFSFPNTYIEVRLARNERGVVISVKDEGQGIPAGEMDKLFKPFHKTSVRSTEDEPSTGLGLAIVKRIILGHQGEIWAESQEGAGSTFYISLPFTT